jgi:hypothetical protein
MIYFLFLTRILQYHVCNVHSPISVAARSKTWIYGRSLLRIVGSNTSEGKDVLSLENVVYCQVEITATG